MIQAALNGNRQGAFIPTTTAQILRESTLAVQAGASCIHFHVRNAAGEETLTSQWVDMQVQAIREYLPQVPVGISTGSWIEPDVAQRIKHIASWHHLPDYVSVNFDEEGHAEVAKAILARGIGIEAGLNSIVATQNFLKCQLAHCLRVLLEPPEQEAVLGDKIVADILDSLNSAGVHLPLLLHGTDNTCWYMLEKAFEKGYDTRIGLEDTLKLENGQLADGNEVLVREAVRLKALLGF